MRQRVQGYALSSNVTNEYGKAVNLGLSPELQLTVQVSNDSEQIIPSFGAYCKKMSLGVLGK